jgi:hypothetical protein
MMGKSAQEKSLTGSDWNGGVYRYDGLKKLWNQ